MSFASDIKEELSRLKTYSNKDSLRAELTGYLVSNAEIMDVIAIFSSENIANIKRLYKVIRTIYEIYDAKFELQCKDRNNLYILPIRVDTFDDLQYLDINYKILLNEDEINKISKHQNLVSGIFRGAFMGSGNISDPNKDYHLDISFKELENAEILCNLALLFDINFKIMQRKKEYIIYLKDSEQISNFLTLIGACSAVLRLEEIKVIKDVRNNVNRLVNCETANLNKTVNASVKVINDIEYLKKEDIYNSLPETLKEIAEVRLDNPNTSIKELGQMMLPPLSKSGVSHRLNKISKIADEYRKRG